MADKSQGNAADVPGMPYYEKSRQHLKELLHKRKILERQLASREESIFSKETEYLENTPNGNIITGFDNYTKGSSGSAAAARRKTGLTEANRVFSRSSISYVGVTPIQTSFKDSNSPASGQATPTSATTHSNATTKNNGGGGHSKKKKSAAAAAAAAAAMEDSETDTRETKKSRTSFGTVRK